MSTTSPLRNIFDADPKAAVVPIEIKGLSLPQVEFAGILASPNYTKVEGRGTYEELSKRIGRYRYVKGAGNVESLRSYTEEDPRRFPQFGHLVSSKFCFGPDSTPTLVGQTPPRVRGALALPYAVGEVIHAAVFLEVLMRKEGIVSVKSAEAKGLTIPEGVVVSPGISEDICDGLLRARRDLRLGDSHENLDYKFGIAALRVPSCERLRSRSDINATKGDFWTRVLRSPEKMEMVGRVLRHQLQCGFVSLSTHLQNVYDAPRSLCPHADSSDLVPISEVLEAGVRGGVDRGVLLEALVMRQLQYLPFNVMRYVGMPQLQNDAKAAIHTILSTVAPGEWTRRERDGFAEGFPRKPYTVLSTIANRLLAMKLVDASPQVDWPSIRAQHARFAYDVVADHLTRVALTSACTLYAAVADAESEGGLSDLF